MRRVLNFGILGAGKIANRFTDAFRYVEGAAVLAAASRDQQKAQAFADKHQIKKAYGSYHDLIHDPEVDIVYVATPHPFHHEHTLLCLNGGKAVLCEKPMAMNLTQTKEMTDTARKKNLFLMEGMWSRFFPSLLKAQELIASGAIGQIQYVHADFGFSAPVNLEGRVYNMALGGGAQLDVGVYPLFLVLCLLGKPVEIKAMSTKASTGADATTSAELKFASGAIGHIFSSIVADSPKDAHIVGDKGRLILQAPWHKSETVSFLPNGGERQDFRYPHSGNGFEFQIRAVVESLNAGKKECDLMPHSLSLNMAEVADEILRQAEVRY